LRRAAALGAFAAARVVAGEAAGWAPADGALYCLQRGYGGFYTKKLVSEGLPGAGRRGGAGRSAAGRRLLLVEAAPRAAG
nr:hypothetical protein [Tanacetum cinerariifolium]